MKTKILAIIITAIIALNMIGISYACWFKPPNCTYYYEVCFVNVTWSDNEKVKDVGNVWANITNCGRKIEIFITNAYPCYETYVNFTLKNKGDKTVHIDSMTLENPNPTALEVTVTNLTCTNLLHSDKAKGTVTTHVLQTAEECNTYTFKITITLENPSVCPGSTGFWGNQFECALQGRTRGAQVDPDTLEDYLNQITDESEIFSFTSTRKQKFQQALAILCPPSRSSMEAKLKAQLLALWLNYVAGWTEGYTIEGMTAEQIIEGSENVLNPGKPNQYEYWKNLCERFNNIH